MKLQINILLEIYYINGRKYHIGGIQGQSKCSMTASPGQFNKGCFGMVCIRLFIIQCPGSAGVNHISTAILPC